MDKSPHLDAAWLRARYEAEGLTTYEIAAMVGRNPKTIWLVLRQHGIPTRPRGANLRTGGRDNYWNVPGREGSFKGQTHSAEALRKMSAHASKPRPHLRGKANGMHGRSGALNPRYVDGSSPERQRAYVSSVWREIMRQVYARDEYTCQRCGAGKTGKRTLHAHHIEPWAGNPSLRFAVENIVTLCGTCHRWVHSRANVEGEWIHSRPALASSDST